MITKTLVTQFMTCFSYLIVQCSFVRCTIPKTWAVHVKPICTLLEHHTGHRIFKSFSQINQMFEGLLYCLQCPGWDSDCNSYLCLHQHTLWQYHVFYWHWSWLHHRADGTLLWCLWPQNILKGLFMWQEIFKKDGCR